MATVERSFFQTTIGKKYIMGATGLVWLGFVFAHMAGNLLIFVSSDAYNMYGHALTSGYFIYFAEAVLVLALISHIFCAISLTLENRNARGDQQYLGKSCGEKSATLASKTMAAQGSVILAFIITHIMTFKYGTFYHTVVDGVHVRDLYKLMIEVFAEPGYVGWYFVALSLLFFHLKHGFASVIQSFGVLNDRISPVVKLAGFAYATVVCAGFLSQPIYIYFFAQ